MHSPHNTHLRAFIILFQRIQQLNTKCTCIDIEQKVHLHCIHIHNEALVVWFGSITSKRRLPATKTLWTTTYNSLPMHWRVFMCYNTFSLCFNSGYYNPVVCSVSVSVHITQHIILVEAAQQHKLNSIKTRMQHTQTHMPQRLYCSHSTNRTIIIYKCSTATTDASAACMIRFGVVGCIVCFRKICMRKTGDECASAGAHRVLILKM